MSPVIWTETRFTETSQCVVKVCQLLEKLMESMMPASVALEMSKSLVIGALLGKQHPSAGPQHGLTNEFHQLAIQLQIQAELGSCKS